VGKILDSYFLQIAHLRQEIVLSGKHIIKKEITTLSCGAIFGTKQFTLFAWKPY
jgi:hypothetical protein